MIQIYIFITIATLLIIYLGHKLYNQGFIKAGSFMILLGCFQLIAEVVATI